MTMAPSLKVYILSHMRPEFIQASLNSVLAQDYPNLELIVSENSPDDRSLAVIQKIRDPRLKIIRRHPSLSAIEHHNAILNEVKGAEFFMMFHDDDILFPGALQKLLAAFDSTTAAVGSNALVIEHQTFTQKLLEQSSEDLILTRAQDLIDTYLNPKLWHAAFPTYVYRTSMVGDLKFDVKKGGKHSDITFLADLLEQGTVKMLAKPMIHYRLHPDNGSRTRDLRPAFSLIRYAKKQGVSPSSLLDYKHKTIAVWAMQHLRQRTNKDLNQRERILIKHAASYLLRHPSQIFQFVQRKFKEKLLSKVRE